MPSRAWVVTGLTCGKRCNCTVSMPSRAYTSFLPRQKVISFCSNRSVSMPSRAYTSFLQRTRDSGWLYPIRVNALSGLYIISTVPLQKPRFYAVSRTCFCRYLSEYSDNSRFSCMLTFWTYLMRCTYPWHWIKYSTNYNRCHPIFHSLFCRGQALDASR